RRRARDCCLPTRGGVPPSRHPRRSRAPQSRPHSVEPLGLLVTALSHGDAGAAEQPPRCWCLRAHRISSLPARFRHFSQVTKSSPRSSVGTPRISAPQSASVGRSRCCSLGCARCATGRSLPPARTGWTACSVTLIRWLRAASPLPCSRHHLREELAHERLDLLVPSRLQRAPPDATRQAICLPRLVRDHG